MPVERDEKNCLFPDKSHNIIRGLFKKKKAFTLAEVLITLGIIGVVAAMTLPVLIQNHNNQVVVARLQKFYSSINQAITLAEKDYGARDMWFEDNSDYEAQKAWCEKYLIPYMNVIKTGKLLNKYYYMTFADGSSVALIASNGRDWYFFPGSIDKCLENHNGLSVTAGKCSFPFYYNPVRKSDGNGYYAWEFGTYASSWNGDVDDLKNNSKFGCNNNTTGFPVYCARWIQVNGWKIPKDYPFRVKYR